MAEKGEHAEIMRAPVDEIRAALMDFEAYPRWQAGVTECTVLERDEQGRGSLVDLVLDAKVRKIRLVLRANYTETNSLSSSLVRGDVKSYTGRYTFVPVEDSTTQVTLEIEFEPGFFLPKQVLKVVQDQMLKATLREVRAHVER